ncbi:hypothetical protein [Desulfovibrio sp. JC022]|uniref:hypothetical protein n=1 Tax=Desulfovibrio sp. JC022 TaxID=2593642 RepID=UPI0013D14FC8|nr:hypothetical protein [Desulfovibrio sp. JC022]NDV23760.1 hypothetical protein [Desulfovibrio sp. JC022]
MGEMIHKVEEQDGVSIHRKIPAKRSHEDFDSSQMSSQTRAAFARVCRDGSASADDYRHVFESVLGRSVVSDILQ